MRGRRKVTSLVAATVMLRQVTLLLHHRHCEHYGHCNRYVKPREYHFSGLIMILMQNGTSELATYFHISQVYNLTMHILVTCKPWTCYSQDDQSWHQTVQLCEREGQKRMGWL